MSKAGKSVSFKVPTSKLASGADAWIANRGAEPATDQESGNVTSLKSVEAAPVEAAKEKMSRFTIDVPESLHRRVKMQCAARGQKMADMMRDLLEREFPAS
jgi:predicted DNA binding CopG/RHH family protein